MIRSMGPSVFDLNPTYLSPAYAEPPYDDYEPDDSDAPGARIEPDDPDWGWLLEMPEAHEVTR